ncbi:MAG TPA: BTAD domain-containing putative transcriptional regulator [Gemmatimonadales bacterium]
MIELRTLGTLALRNAGGEDLLSVLAQPKRVALLAYLALARPHGFQRRDTLLALLWPEQDEQHARWALNQSLRHLRQALGKEALPSRGDGEVGIEPRALWCDAVAFEAAIEDDDPGGALELYRGDLLDGFHVSGCGEFERWLAEERVWLRRRAARTAAALARREGARGEPVAAGHWARHALALAPDDEGEVRGLIELLGRVGDRAGAVQAYEEFARRLRDEYQVEPAPETVATITKLRRRQPERSAPNSEGPRSDPGEGEPAASFPVPRPATRPRRRHLLVAIGLIVLLAVGGTIRALRPPAEPSGAPAAALTTIAVLPFTYRGSPEFGYLSEGMVDLLSANLNGAGELRTVDPGAVLAQVRHAGRDRLEHGQVQRLAARLGAGSYVQGHIVETGGRLRISARLYAGGVVEGRGEALVGGPSTQLFHLVDGLTAQLIAQQSGGPAGSLSRLAALTTDSLAALKAYLEGERYFRAGQADSCLRILERAVRIDSSFALAHYRLATAVWKFRPVPLPAPALAREALDRALRHSDRLSDSDRRLFRAFAAQIHGRLSEAERRYRDIVSRHPDNVEATFQLAELVLHQERDRELRYSWLEAREWFERVLAIDPSHRHALTHLSHIAARERRLGELDSLLSLLPRGDWFLRGQRAIVFGDTAAIDRFLARLREGGDEVQPPAGFLVFTTGDLGTGRKIWRVFAGPSRSRGQRVLAHLTLAKMEVMTGRWSVAKAELDAAAALDAATALEHRALLSLWPLMRVPHSELRALRDSLLRWKAVAGPSNQTSVSGDHAPAHPYLRVYLLGLLDVGLGDLTAALAGAADLERRAERSFAPAFIRDLGRALRAEVARARGSPAEALTILDSLEYWTDGELDATGDSPFFVHEREHFTRAALLDALGRDQEAIRAYRVMADLLFHSGAPAHFRLAEIHQRRGERWKAAEHYARFIELWQDCDPELRSLVQDARRRMAKLTTADPTPSDSQHTPPPHNDTTSDMTLGAR